MLARVGPVAYKLALPSGSKIHTVFHISLLKRFHGSQIVAPHILPSISVDNQPLYRPATICAVRTVLKQGGKCRQILVQWQDSSPEDSTWEEFERFCKLYPDLHLEDKVSFEAGGNDTTLQIQLNQPEYLQEEQPNDESDYEQPKEETMSHVEERAEHNESQKSTRIRKPPGWLKDYVV